MSWLVGFICGAILIESILLALFAGPILIAIGVYLLAVGQSGNGWLLVCLGAWVSFFALWIVLPAVREWAAEEG